MQTTILTDIEGTTSSISFVKDVLFPYARRELPRFVRERGDEPEVRRWLDMVAAEHGGICQDAVIVETLQGMIDQDRKHTALKALQGMIWLEGYRSRDFSAHVYPDVATSSRCTRPGRWRRRSCCSAIRMPATCCRCSMPSSIPKPATSAMRTATG